MNEKLSLKTTPEWLLRFALESSTYDSSIGLGARKFHSHHIDAIIKAILPVVEELIHERRSDV